MVGQTSRCFALLSMTEYSEGMLCVAQRDKTQRGDCHGLFQALLIRMILSATYGSDNSDVYLQIDMGNICHFTL